MLLLKVCSRLLCTIMINAVSKQYFKRELMHDLFALFYLNFIKKYVKVFECINIIF